MPRLRASIVVIGDEILGGFVQDTNSGWLAQRLRLAGVPLDRVLTVPDELEVISATVAGELARPRPRVVLTSGGIGSTPDDLTMAAVAHCLAVELVPEPTIAAHIARALAWHEQSGLPLTERHAEAMRRMALVPDGSYLLPGVKGFVPGVAVDVDGGVGASGQDGAGGATVVVLPGVPSELRRITMEGVEPALLAGRGRPDHVVEISHPWPESMVNPVLERLVEEYPDVHLGSYPGLECLVRLSGERGRVEEAAGVVRDYLAELASAPGAARLQRAWRERWAASVD